MSCNNVCGMPKLGKNKESEEASVLLLDMPGLYKWSHIVKLLSFLNTHRCKSGTVLLGRLSVARL